MYSIIIIVFAAISNYHHDHHRHHHHHRSWLNRFFAISRDFWNHIRRQKYTWIDIHIECQMMYNRHSSIFELVGEGTRQKMVISLWKCAKTPTKPSTDSPTINQQRQQNQYQYGGISSIESNLFTMWRTRACTCNSTTITIVNTNTNINNNQHHYNEWRWPPS